MASRLIKYLLAPAFFLFLSVLNLSSQDFTEYRIILADLINNERKNNNLNVLFSETAADKTAQKYAEELAERKVLSHTGKNGTRVEERYRNSGGTGLLSGENIAVSDSPYKIFQAWMKSPLHKENLLNPDWNSFGLGFAGINGKRFTAVLVFTNSLWRRITVTCSENNLVIKGLCFIPENTESKNFKIHINGKIVSLNGNEVNLTVPCTDFSNSVVPLWLSYTAEKRNGLKEFFTDVDFIEIPYYDN